jgi:two-component system sensor histidine kinase FlrB
MIRSGSASRQQLEDAFLVFNQVSEQLVDSYQKLQLQVQQLSRQLSAARSGKLKQLAEKERLANRITRLLETLPAAVIVLDGERRVQEFNPPAQEMLDALTTGSSWDQVYLDHFRPGQSGDEQWLSSGRRISFIEKGLDPEPGQIILLIDVTETRELQESIARQHRLSTMGEMAAQLAHQIRTPLSTALLYTSHLSRDDLTPQQRRRFSSQCSDRLRHIERQINDMLNFARGGQFELGLVDFHDLLNEFKVSLRPLLSDKQAHLTLTGDLIPGIKVSGNQVALLGALMNLAVNALEQGATEICIGVWHIEDEDSVELTISDNGTGIPADVKEQIFDPFFTTRSDGTGLGLAVVQSVVIAHKGNISVESAPGRGTDFYISLPLASEAETETHAILPGHSRMAESEGLRSVI